MLASMLSFLVLYFTVVLQKHRFLGEMQRIAFCLMLSSVCVSVRMPRLWMPGKRFEIETVFLIARNNTGHNL